MVSNFFKKMVKEKRKLCLGCDSFVVNSTGNLNCGLPPIYNSKDKCPCFECLVKVTCTKSCDKFKNFKNIIPRHHLSALQNIYLTAKKEAK